MTHPTDDEIMELAGAWFHTGENQKRDDGYYYRSLGTPSNVRGSDLIEFARALLAEQAKDAAEDAPSAVELLARVIELEKALSAMLTHMGMDEDEWNKPTFDQARAALRKGHYGDAKTST